MPANDIQKWDSFVRQHGHLLQLSAWGALKSDFGWYAERITITDSEGSITAGAQILFRKLPFGLGTLAYLPYAPIVDWTKPDQVQAIMQAVDSTARQNRAIFLKAEPGYGIKAEWMHTAGFQASTQTIQPPATIMLDLDDDEDTILKRMNQGTRRNIRKSEKFNVEVYEGTHADVDHFNAMLDETGERQGFGVHVAEYYERAFDLFVSRGDAVLLMARYEDV
ncbi:MAG TPA: peptidoglycan bridge formation glycyltransferase FemA/FemB family protein, partial [Aggregatilineales bacterium]|nr:peptidoglycan bridge formation glycyltransferase FemA/FemB family protein [Aggregatilineales bacterium]